MEITKEPLFVRSIVFGFVMGVAYVILRQILPPLSQEMFYVVIIAFCAALAFVSFRFVGVPVFGLILGAVALVAVEVVYALLHGGVPFVTTVLSLSEYYRYVGAQIMMGTLLLWIGFPLAGFLGSYMVLRMGDTNLAYMSSEIDGLEKKVLDYIKKHNNQIKVSECALELDLKENDVTRIIGSLQEKGLLMQK